MSKRTVRLLTFAKLQASNADRLPEFKNAKGATAHKKSDGSDWTLLEWAGAMCGEAGEAANVAKKLRRGDIHLVAGNPTGRKLLADEIADTVIYADLLATQAGISLGDAVREKFNETSKKVGSSVRL